jgi:2-oxo-3-hexenedioate decarboxylase
MSPEQLLAHSDQGIPWPATLAPQGDMAAAYQGALAVRALRIARGDKPRGFKIGFTNRTIWERYRVYAPMWGTVWESGLRFLADPGDEGSLDLARTCEPRLEPETVFGLARTPAPQAGLQPLYEALDWVAPGFEIVQSHRPGWKFTAGDTALDNGLHGRLLVGRRIPVREFAASGTALHERLAGATVALRHGERTLDEGRGANVLDSPLAALAHFLAELRACPGAPDLQPGDVVTTGTWTDAWPVQAGQHWSARFSDSALGTLRVAFT